MGLSLVFGGWPTFIALVSVGTCIAFAWRANQRLAQLSAPAPSQLLAELVEAAAEGAALTESASRSAVAELNQRISDVAFELTLSPARFASLTRISLASGTALALVAIMRTDSQVAVERILHAGMCAVSGFVGAGVVATLGRMARRRALRIRSEWDRTSREVGKALGTALG